MLRYPLPLAVKFPAALMLALTLTHTLTPLPSDLPPLLLPLFHHPPPPPPFATSQAATDATGGTGGTAETAERLSTPKAGMRTSSSNKEKGPPVPRRRSRA